MKVVGPSSPKKELIIFLLYIVHANNESVEFRKIMITTKIIRKKKYM